MSLKDNTGYINLKSENREGFIDLEVQVSGDIIYVNDDNEGLGFTIEEIEALYHFSQILRVNNKF